MNLPCRCVEDLLAGRLRLQVPSAGALGARARMLCAGSLGSIRRWENPEAAGCEASTVATAVFEGSFASDQQTAGGRMHAVLETVQ